MGVIELILLAAITTALVAWFKFFYTTLQEAYLIQVDNTFTQSPFISGVVFLAVALISSPLLLLPVIIPSMEAKFKSGLAAVILAEEK